MKHVVIVDNDGQYRVAGFDGLRAIKPYSAAFETPRAAIDHAQYLDEPASSRSEPSGRVQAIGEASAQSGTPEASGVRTTVQRARHPEAMALRTLSHRTRLHARVRRRLHPAWGLTWK